MSAGAGTDTVTEMGDVVMRAQAGEADAFTELVQRYQAMAFGYALAILRDVSLAQDATQQTFIAAHGSLPRLEDAERFPSWLRAIIRHQCARIRRKRRLPTVALEAAAELQAREPGPEQRAEERDTFEIAMAAVEALPDREREVAILYYLREYSQQEIATFLALPVTTINNRLHAARTKLRAMLKEPASVGSALNRHRPPDEFAADVGRVVRVRGPLLDVRFASGELPPIFNRLTTAAGGRHLQVAQRLDPGVVRCIAETSEPNTAAPHPADSDVVDTDSVGGNSVGAETVQSIVKLLGPTPREARPSLVETGIKAIDLLCPYPNLGRIGLFSDLGVGKMVLLNELVHNLGPQAGRLTVFAFVRSADEVPFLRGLIDREEEVFPSSAAVQAIYLPIAEPRDLLRRPAGDIFDATTNLIRQSARLGIFPAIDPLRSTSSLLQAKHIGSEHLAVASEVRRLLRRWRRYLWTTEMPSVSGLSADDRLLAGRARRALRFLSQPMFVAAPFTGTPGQFVPLAETLRSFRAILSGDYDDVPEDAFLMCGSIDDLTARIASLEAGTDSAAAATSDA